MKKSTARRQERKARAEQKRATTTTIKDPNGGPDWTAHAGSPCLVRWEDAPEPKPERGPRAVGHLAWGTAGRDDR